MENDNIMLDVDSENKTINIKIINEENIIGILTDIITKKNIMSEKIYKLLELLNIESIENIDKKDIIIVRVFREDIYYRRTRNF
jgi:hypothetical protein